MADKAFITPKVLKWARESARMTLETAASKVAVEPARLEAWEEGTEYPTIGQAEKLAKAYKRPFALLFLPDVPRDFQPLQDFRRKTAKPLGTGSVFIIREIQQKQAWISEVFAENNEEPLPFVGRFKINSDPQKVAEDVLRTLGINPSQYSVGSPIKEWITKAEAKGIFISKTSFINTRLKLDSDELQGFTIADKHAPFVFINSDDWSAPLLFTLVHELAHIWVAESGISNEIEPEIKHKDKLHPVELFCNEVAANALMPAEIMRNYTAAVFNSGLSVFSAAEKMGVSTFAFLVRAMNMNMVSVEKYRKLKREADDGFREFQLKEEEKMAKQKAQKSGPNYYTLLVNRNGHQFTRVVMDAFRGGFIEPTQASSLLSTQINNFPKLENFLYK